MTQRSKIIETLKAHGWEKVTNTQVLKADVYSRKGAKRNIYVGKAGSLRIGRVKTESYPVNAALKKMMLTGVLTERAISVLSS